MDNKYKLAAAGCSILYLLAFLIFPFLGVKFIGLGVSGMDCISVSAWAYLPLIAGIAMIICNIVLDSRNAMIVDIVASFIPLIAFFLVRGDVTGGVSSVLGGRLPALSSIGANVIFTLGFGLILSILFGIASAVLSYFAGNVQKPAKREPGLGTSVDDEW